MNTKKIINIVFYTTIIDGEKVKKAELFYDNGTSEEVTYEKALDACELIAKEMNVTTMDAFKTMINNNMIHVISDRELSTNRDRYFSNYLSNEDDNVKTYSKNTDRRILIGRGLYRKVAALGIAGVMLMSTASCGKKIEPTTLPKNSFNTMDEDDHYLDGRLDDDIQELGNDDLIENNDDEVDDEHLVIGDNQFYDDYTVNQLLKVTKNTSQRLAMKNLYNTIVNFNGDFADYYQETVKINDNKAMIRPALTFDEVSALQVAYNDYNKGEISAIFNGAEVDSETMTRAYKDATLQLMGSYIIETEDKTVDMSDLIESDAGKEFYHKYHKVFLEAKFATGSEKVEKVNEFYKLVREDFPITPEDRTEGISHADTYAKVKDYMISVTPMIAAAEVLFQNLDTDYTLDDSEIDFINDIGLCNYAESKFEKVEIITLSHDADSINPLYTQYRKAIIKELVNKNQYVFDDEHRELTYLSSFQKAINWHFDIIDGAEWSYNGNFYETSTTHTEVEEWTETETSYYEEETITEKTIPDDVKADIDAQIASENEDAKNKGYEDAEEKRKELQDEEDENAKKVYNEVEEDEADMQDKIADANDKINNNNSDDDQSNDIPVNESDFGDHDVDFDDQHSDENGNLDPSVEDITIDPTGDKTNDPLPDPNETGALFDAQASYYSSPSTDDGQVSDYTDDGQVSDYVNDSEDSNDGVYTEYVSDDAYIEFPSDYDYYESDNQSIIEYESAYTDEDLVNAYVESLSNQGTSEEVYQYTR